MESETAGSIEREARYAFQDIKTYADTEWLANNRKRYRQVFDEGEVSYIYVELSLVNKAFELEDWDVTVELKCFRSDKRSKEICNLVLQRKIAASSSVAYIREGWGNKKVGLFWKPGAYLWEAWIDGKKVGTRYFYIQSSGQRPVEIPGDYLELKSVRLYEASIEDQLEEERMYLKELDFSETKYVYVEVEFENQLPDLSWHLELITRFFNESRELKGQVVKLMKIDPDQETIRLSVGWGTSTKGSWREGNYTAELIFMDRLIATVHIPFGLDHEPGFPLVWLPGEKEAKILGSPKPNEEGLAAVLAKLDNLVGLDQVKRSVREHALYMEFLRLREKRGFVERDQVQMHAVFKGNPGTGKTTVAGMMGAIYFQLGLLSKGHVHSVDRADLVGEYIGQTAPKVRHALDQARGGVLLIDEAYALARTNDDAKDFGREVIEMLVKEMSDGPGDLAVIAAGYPAEMDHFVASNPGLRSRFKIVLDFQDYQPADLQKIAALAATHMEVQPTEEATRLINQVIVRSYRDRDRTFGNARYVYDLIEKCKIQLGLRIMRSEEAEGLPVDKLRAITAEDVLLATHLVANGTVRLPVDEELLAEALHELDGLVGLPTIKQEIHDLVLLIKFELSRAEASRDPFSMHTIFIGNPGTGKTTIARILAKVYKALGLLERGHVIETDRAGLVAGFVGQTAIKTAERIEEAKGGVLFIDEAYSLTQPGSGRAGDFGDEAIQTLLKRMEDQRGQFFVFVAGYPDNMEVFLKANPGLKSRFDRTLVFPDYTEQELLEIAQNIIREQGYSLDPEASLLVEEWVTKLHQRRDRYFGNARTIRQLLDELIKAHRTALARDFGSGTPLDEHIISGSTVLQVQLQEDRSAWSKSGIGFKKN
ncbi:MAG: AAA family ATPase [Saprospiraceae bacterium]|nr:AAA family ATPase [Saprospiraceae bacterium]